MRSTVRIVSAAEWIKDGCPVAIAIAKKLARELDISFDELIAGKVTKKMPRKTKRGNIT